MLEGKFEQVLKSWKEKKNFFEKLEGEKKKEKKKANCRTATDSRRRG